MELRQDEANGVAIGAHVEAWDGDRRVAAGDVSAGSRGVFSSGPPEVHLGLGDLASVELRVRWPDGDWTVYEGVPTRRGVIATRP